MIVPLYIRLLLLVKIVYRLIPGMEYYFSINLLETTGGIDYTTLSSSYTERESVGE